MRNPTRRSRNIGTAKQGHGQNNRLTLPVSNYPARRIFCENLRDFRTERHSIGEQALVFLIEKPRPGVVHACSIEDIVRVLACVPSDDLWGLDMVVLRQPKRKEEILSPVWGRYFSFLEIGDLSGCTILLESLDLRKPIRWAKPLSAHWLKQLEHLRSQGHVIRETQRFFEIFSTLEAVRETQLFQTLPHEVGHHVHSLSDENFFNRTKREKEDFAEKYARDFMEKFGAILK
jgi:hypothetical protein